MNYDYELDKIGSREIAIAADVAKSLGFGDVNVSADEFNRRVNEYIAEFRTQKAVESD